MRALRVRAPILKILAARKAYKQERYRGTERRQQLRDESRLETFFRMGAALALAPACSWRTPGTASHYVQLGSESKASPQFGRVSFQIRQLYRLKPRFAGYNSYLVLFTFYFLLYLPNHQPRSQFQLAEEENKSDETYSELTRVKSNFRSRKVRQRYSQLDEHEVLGFSQILWAEI